MLHMRHHFKVTHLLSTFAVDKSHVLDTVCISYSLWFLAKLMVQGAKPTGGSLSNVKPLNFGGRSYEFLGAVLLTFVSVVISFG